MIDKGKVSTILDSGAKVTVVPSTAFDTVTIALTVPEHIKGSLTVGMELVYAMFDDNTGIVLSRLDGKWNHTITGNVTVTGGDVTADGISLKTHVHSGVTTGSSNTGQPVS